MEVANLLKSIYRNYIHEAFEIDVLIQLMKFFHDLNLTESLSILDVERIRLKVMKSNNRENMDYDTFSEFLKESSNFIYKKFDGESRNRETSWNLMLTQIIIPFATKEREPNLSATSLFSTELVLPEVSSLRIMLSYRDFLHFWFSSRNFSDELRLSPSCNFCLRLIHQAQPSHPLDIIGLDRIFDTLKSCDIFTNEGGKFFSEKVLVASTPRDISGTGNYFNCLGFPEFLTILENIAKKVSLSDVQSLGMGSSISTKLIVLLQTVSRKLLDLTLQNFAAYEMRVTKSNDKFLQQTAYVMTDSYSSRVGLPPVSNALSISSVLWLCRQSGITDLPGLTIHTLLNELLARSDATQRRETRTSDMSGEYKTEAWSLAHLPHSLCQIVETYTQEKLGMVGGLIGISSPGRIALLLAQLKPEIFFISPTILPILKSFYTEECIRALHDVVGEIDAFFCKVLDPNPGFPFPTSSAMISPINAINSKQRSIVETLTFREFNQIFEQSGVVPHVLSPSMMLEICEHMIGFSFKGSSVDIQIGKNDWIEILYVIAQSCFEDDNDGNSLERKVEKQLKISKKSTLNSSIRLCSSDNKCIQRLLDLIRCLKNLAYLPHIIGILRNEKKQQIFLKQSIKMNWIYRKEPESKSFVRSLFRETETHVEHPSSKSPSNLNNQKGSKLVRIPQSPVVYNGVRDTGGGRGNSGFSLREITILLMHYPLNNFHLNPWNMFEILSIASSPSSPPSPSTTHALSVSTAGDLPTIAKMLQSFCSRYRVPSSDLTKYFASFYKEESYPADTARTAIVQNAQTEENLLEPYVNSPSYAKKKTVKLAVQGVLKSSVFDLLFIEKISTLLQTNAGLLCWEFSKASSQHRSLDSFTADLTVPFISLHTMRMMPDNCKVTLISAIKWAEVMAEINGDEALLQLKRAALLSGDLGVDSNYQLTFPVFLIYAIHCFSTRALLNTTGTLLQDEDVLESCLKKMIQRINTRLDLISHSLELGIDLVRTMCGVTSQENGMTCIKDSHLSAADKLVLVRHALLTFNLYKKKSASSCARDRIPPQPPIILWDACRFVEFCCFYGLLERMDSLTSVGKAFKNYLHKMNSLNDRSNPDNDIDNESSNIDDHRDINRSNSSHNNRVANVLPLTPIRVSPSVVISLLDELNQDSISSLNTANSDTSIQYGLLPMMISLHNLDSLFSNRDQISPEHGRTRIEAPVIPFPLAGDQRHTRSLEDILRYGGNSAMSSFILYASHIHEAFYSFCEASSHTQSGSHGIMESQQGEVNSQKNTSRSNTNIISKEAVLSAVCKYVSCCGLLQPGMVSKIAKRSLLARLRSRTLLVPREDIPHGTKENPDPSKDEIAYDIVTVSLAEFEEMFVRCAFYTWELSGALGNSSSDSEPDPDALLQYCNSISSEISSSMRDIVYKYCIEGMLVSNPPAGKTASGEDKKDTRLSWGVDFIGPFARTLLAMSPNPNVTKDEEDEAAIARKSELAQHMVDMKERLLVEEKMLRAKEEAFLIGRSYVDSYMLPREPTAPLLVDVKVPEIAPIQQLLDKTEYLNQLSSGIHILLDGTKEELWPVYATYCSCGDSIDPGKLSGPNLFTLLSKLGILNNRTIISDVGILLHQISAHLQAQSTSSLVSSENIESPSLSFEQFLVFLCSYSQLFFDRSEDPSIGDPSASHRNQNNSTYDGINNTIPMHSSTPLSLLSSNSQSVTNPSIIVKHNEIKINDSFSKNVLGGSAGLSIIINQTQNVPSRAWFAQWQDYMNSSSTFRRLLENHMLPVLRGHTLLAFPDDARLRDKYAVLFSLEVILTLQRVEAVLRSVFCIKGHTEKPSKEGMKGREGMEEGDKGRSVSPMPLDPHHYWHHLMMPIIIALRRINLVPQVISEAHIMQLMKDVMPERVVKGGKRKNSEDFVQVNTEDWEQTLLFPHWEWIICVVAYEAMDVTVRVSSTATDPALIPSLVAKLIAAIATAMEASFSSQR